MSSGRAARSAGHFSVVVFGSLVLLASTTHAQPAVTSISGATVHGSTLVISGNGFGVKSRTVPLAFENFEDGTLHSSLTLHQSAVGSTTITNPNNLRHQFATFNARTDFKRGDGFFEYNAGTASKWFVQYFVKLAPNWHWGTSTFEGPDDGLANVKIMRFYPFGARNFTNVMYNEQGFNGFSIMRQTVTSVGAGSTAFFGDVRTMFPVDAWNSVQVEYKENSGVDQPDGTLRLWINGQLVDSTTTLITNAAADGSAVNKRPYVIGFYDSWPASDADVSNMYAYYSDIYVDDTWARVEIGNANTYEACSRREAQLPTGWSDSSVIVQFNQGAFANGDTVYLYVVDADGYVNGNGFPLVIGAGVPVKPLSAPSGLNIVK